MTVFGAERIHAPLEQGTVLAPEEGGLVRDVLHVRCTGPQRDGIQQCLVVRAEPGEHRQVVAALEHVHGVDLQQAEAVDQPVQLTGAHDRRAWATEALRRECDATCEFRRDRGRS